MTQCQAELPQGLLCVCRHLNVCAYMKAWGAGGGSRGSAWGSWDTLREGLFARAWLLGGAWPPSCPLSCCSSTVLILWAWLGVFQMERGHALALVGPGLFGRLVKVHSTVDACQCLGQVGLGGLWTPCCMQGLFPSGPASKQAIHPPRLPGHSLVECMQLIPAPAAPLGPDPLRSAGKVWPMSTQTALCHHQQAKCSF